MKLPHIMRALRQDPWLCTEAAWRSADEIVRSRLAGGVSSLTGAELAHLVGHSAKVTWTDDGPLWESDYEVVGDVAVISGVGMLMKGASNLAKVCGACSPEDIEADFKKAIADESVNSIVFYANSPGGHVRGIPELAAKMAKWNAQKRVRVFTDGMLCSAMYYLAAGCHSIYATATADVGSIGVLMVYEDESGAYAQQGIKPVVFAGGRLKGQGTPGTSLSPEMVAHLTERTQLLYDQFTGHVSAYRKRVQPDTMQGQSFLGVQAAQNGLIDGIADNINEVIAKR